MSEKTPEEVVCRFCNRLVVPGSAKTEEDFLALSAGHLNDCSWVVTQGACGEITYHCESCMDSGCRKCSYGQDAEVVRLQKDLAAERKAREEAEIVNGHLFDYSCKSDREHADKMSGARKEVEYWKSTLGSLAYQHLESKLKEAEERNKNLSEAFGMAAADFARQKKILDEQTEHYCSLSGKLKESQGETEALRGG